MKVFRSLIVLGQPTITKCDTLGVLNNGNVLLTVVESEIPEIRLPASSVPGEVSGL